MGGYKGNSGYGGCTSKGCNFGTSFGSSFGSSRGASFSPVKKRTVAGYAGWEHPSMRLLRSLGKEPETGGKACGYGCLDACEEPEEVTIEKTTPRTIKMWDLPSR